MVSSLACILHRRPGVKYSVQLGTHNCLVDSILYSNMSDKVVVLRLTKHVR